ncbi:MAG: acyl-CoA thioesterase [bacterium]
MTEDKVGRTWQYNENGRRVVVYTFRPLYQQTDKMGVVYYANYFLFFEAGRVEYMRHLGLSYKQLEDEHSLAMPVIETYCKYRKFAHYDNILEIHTTAERSGKAKVKFNYKIIRDDDLIAEGYTIHPIMDMKGRLVKIPDDIDKLLD